MIKIKILFPLLLLCVSAAFSAGELRVQAVDLELEIPLEGVRLTVSGYAVEAETDTQGQATLTLPDTFERGILIAVLPGYEMIRLPITARLQQTKLAMRIAGVIEGNELLVERSAPGKSDAKSGISVAMDREEMKTTAFIGLVEDIMASVSTLPGVGFTGGWNAEPSIRGGYPAEMGTVLDGVYIVEPWHWGGAFSIFNPHMVSSFKMSHGIFSTRYGRAMSGLLEVTTKKPDGPEVRLDASISTTSTDVFFQVPFGQNAGLLAGGKVTYLETLALANELLQLNPELSETVPKMPYIRDAYVKGYWTPRPALDISVNAFFGSDGASAAGDTLNEGIHTVSRFDWTNYLGFASANIRWMPDTDTTVRLLAAYNNNTVEAAFRSVESGTREYSQEFLDTYGPILGGATDYSFEDIGLEGEFSTELHQGQFKLDADHSAGKAGIIGWGLEEVFQYALNDQHLDGWQINDPGDGTLQYSPLELDLKIDGNRILNSAAFLLWEFGSESSALRGEAGLRAEHFYLWNDHFELNTYPVVNPRLSLSWVPLRNRGLLDSLTVSGGSGVFSQFPLDSIGADKDYGIESFEVGPNRAWFQVLGLNLDFIEDWSFQLEGFYKHYFNRLYLVSDIRDTDNTVFLAKTDGTGFATGFDLMLQKKNSRVLDGYVSYSFVYARYLNPESPMYAGQTTMYGEPLDSWYYPGFHRFHSLNLILNWKPVTGMVITLKSSVATGTPKQRVGTITAYPAYLPDGTIIERYARTEIYDNSLRTDISCPVDVRIGWSKYRPNSRIREEVYFAMEDVFTNLYSPRTNKAFDPYTGQELENSDQANFSIGMPMFSFGYKFSY